MGYALEVAVLDSEIKGVKQKLTAGRNYSMPIRNQYEKKIKAKKNGYRHKDNEFEFTIPVRSEVVEFELGEGDADRLAGTAADVIAARGGNANSAAYQDPVAGRGRVGQPPAKGFRQHSDEFQGMDRFTDEIAIGKGFRESFVISAFDHLFNEDTGDYEMDATSHMAARYDAGLFNLMQNAACNFVPGYVGPPGGKDFNDPKNTRGALNTWKFHLLKAMMRSQGAFGFDTIPQIYVREEEQPFINEAMSAYDITRATKEEIQKRQGFQGMIADMELTQAPGVRLFQASKYGNTTDGEGGADRVGFDFQIDGANNSVDHNGLLAKGRKNILYQRTLVLKCKLPAGVALTKAQAEALFPVLGPKTVINISKTRGALTAAKSPDGTARVEADSNRAGGISTYLGATGIVYDTNQALNDEVIVPKPITVHGCSQISATGAGEATAIAAGGTFKVTVTVGPELISAGRYGNISRAPEANDKVSVVSGAPGGKFLEAVGWVSNALGIIHKNPLDPRGTGNMYPDRVTKVMADDRFSGAVFGSILWSDPDNRMGKLSKEMLYGAKAICPWWFAGRIRGAEV